MKESNELLRKLKESFKDVTLKVRKIVSKLSIQNLLLITKVLMVCSILSLGVYSYWNYNLNAGIPGAIETTNKDMREIGQRIQKKYSELFNEDKINAEVEENMREMEEYEQEIAENRAEASEKIQSSEYYQEYNEVQINLEHYERYPESLAWSNWYTHSGFESLEEYKFRMEASDPNSESYNPQLYYDYLEENSHLEDPYADVRFP